MFLLVEGLWDDLTLVSGILYESLCVVVPGRTGRLRRRPSDEPGHGPFSERRRPDRPGPQPGRPVESLQTNGRTIRPTMSRRNRSLRHQLQLPWPPTLRLRSQKIQTHHSR